MAMVDGSELNPRICRGERECNPREQKYERARRERRLRTRSSPPHFSPRVRFRNSPSEKIFQQRRRRNGTLIRAHFVLKLRREKWQFITFISPFPCPRFLVKADVTWFFAIYFPVNRTAYKGYIFVLNVYEMSIHCRSKFMFKI